MQILSSQPHPTLGRWPLPEDARGHFRNRFYLMNSHFGKDLGAKVARFFFKKETINLIFVIKYVASLWFPPLFFLLLKPTSATKKTIALCTVFSLLGSALHRGNYFEPIKPITRGFLFLSFKFLFFLFFFFSLCHRIQEWGRMLTGPGWVALKVPCPFWCKQTWLI